MKIFNKSKFEMDFRLYETSKIFPEGTLLYPTGSRVIGGYGRASDFDIVVLVEDEKIYHKISDILVKHTYIYSGGDYPGGDMKVYRDHFNTNLIVINNRRLYDCWVECTEVCIRNKVRVKSHRINIFNAIRSSWGFV